MSNLVQSNKENWLAIKEQADAVKKAGLLPRDMTSEQAAIIVLKGQELGLGTMRALEGLYVVNGKIGMSASLVMGLIRERCPKAKIEVVRKDNKGCVIEATRPGQETETFQFLDTDARAAGLLKPNSPWEKYPQSMYWSRAVTNMGRQLFSDVLGAPYSPEELGGENEEEIESTPNNLQIHNIPVQGLKLEHNTNSEPAEAKGTTKSSLNERLQPQAATLAVTHPPKSEPVTVDVETGEIEPFDKFPDHAPAKVAARNKPIPSLVPNHWDRVASSGPNSGKTLREIFNAVKKDEFIKMYQVSTNKIGKMTKEGKSVPESTMKTYLDLEACCKELGVQ